MIGNTSFSILEKVITPIIIMLAINRFAALEFLTHHEIILSITI